MSPKLLHVREKLGRIVTCPVGQSVYSQAGWNPLHNNVIVSMTLMPDSYWRPPGTVGRGGASHLDGIDIYLEIGGRTEYMRAPALVLMDHYWRRHGNASPSEAFQVVAREIKQAVLELGELKGGLDESTASMLVGLWQKLHETVLEVHPVVVPKQQSIRVMSSAPIDALAVLEVGHARDMT